MNKKQIQKRVLQNGKPLAISKFTWDEKTKIFSSSEDNLVLDFSDISYCTFKTGSGCTFKTSNNCTFKTGNYCTFDTGSDCTFKTGSDCTFKTGSYCTFDTGNYCTFDTGWDCTFDTGSDCTFDTGSDCTFRTDSNCTFRTDSNCTFKTGWDCTFRTGSGCTFKTGSGCTFNTGLDCTFDTGSDCTFKTGNYCTFDTGWNCTFDTGNYCTFDTGWNCTFDTGEKCVIVRRDIFEVIQPKEDEIVQICPYQIPGYLSNGLYNGEPHVIVDGILSKVISKKGNVTKVINHGETKTTYIVEKNGLFAHGATIKKAKEDIIYKISNRDTTKYKDFALNTSMTKEEAIEMYMVITGACSEGTKYFVNNNTIKDILTVQEVIDITKGQYNHNLLTEFFKSIDIVI